MPRRVVEKVVDALSSRSRRPINGARVLSVGVSYNRNLDDMREGPALAILLDVPR